MATATTTKKQQKKAEAAEQRKRLDEVKTLALRQGYVTEDQVIWLLDDNQDPDRQVEQMEEIHTMLGKMHIEVFASDIGLEGVTISDKPSMIIGQPAGQPSIVISQLWYEKSGTATNEFIHDFLVGEGFRPVPASYFGWFRPEAALAS